MAFIGIAAKVKKFAVSKITAYKEKKKEEKEIYDKAFKAARTSAIKEQAKLRATEIAREASLDAKYGGKLKRFVVETNKKIKQNRSQGKTLFGTKPDKNNPWIKSGQSVKNPWR